MIMINNTAHYVNQYHDVLDRPETPNVKEQERTCNICCVAMITGEDVNDIFQWFVDKYGWNDKFQTEEYIIPYLNVRGFKAEALTVNTWPKSWKPTQAEIDKMIDAIDRGCWVLYHKFGHYQLMVGHDGDDLIFNDPAGDRRLPVNERARESGHLVAYPRSMIMNEPRFGRCWAVS